MMIQACSTPKLPARLARIRRAVESERMDTLRELSKSIKKVSKKEKAAFDSFLKQTREYFDDAMDDEDDEIKNPEVL